MRTIEVKYQVSSIKCQVSSVKYQVSSITYQVSSTVNTWDRSHIIACSQTRECEMSTDPDPEHVLGFRPNCCVLYYVQNTYIRIYYTYLCIHTIGITSFNRFRSCVKHKLVVDVSQNGKVTHTQLKIR